MSNSEILIRGSEDKLRVQGTQVFEIKVVIEDYIKIGGELEELGWN